MAPLTEITIKFSGDGPYRKDVPRAFVHTTTNNMNCCFTLNVVYDDNWFDNQIIHVENYNLGLQLLKFLTDMKEFLNSEALHMTPYEIVHENNVVASG